MDDFVDPTLLDLDRYAIGQPVPRSEDPVLVSGKGRFKPTARSCAAIMRTV
jgi:hypothetical protein